MPNNPENSTSIKALLQSLMPDPGGTIQGIVKSVSPLTVQVVNDDKLTLNASLLIVPKHLTDHSVTVDIKQSDGSTLSQATLVIYDGLKVGEAVHLLSLNEGKKYYVLGRVV